MNTDLWFPDAIRKPIPAGANDPAIIPIGNIFHVAVSEAPSLFDFFDGRSGGIESHGYIRRDGTLEQYRDALHEADANYLANSFVRGGRRYGFLSWETQGMGPGEWTPEQLATIKAIIRWTNTTHGVPLRVAPDWDQPGNGYHTLFPQWSNVPGKTCPGSDRIKQFHNTIAPWLTAGAQEDTMTAADVWHHKLGVLGTDNEINAGMMLRQTHNRAGGAREAARACLESLGEIAKVLGNTGLSETEKADLVDRIATRTAAEVERLDAEAVADRLEITPKQEES